MRAVKNDMQAQFTGVSSLFDFGYLKEYPIVKTKRFIESLLVNQYIAQKLKL